MNCINRLIFSAALLLTSLFLVSCSSTPKKTLNTLPGLNRSAQAPVAGDTVKKQYLRALDAIEQQQWQQATTQLNAIIKDNSAINTPEIMLAWILWQQNNRDAAAKRLEQIIQKPLYRSDAYNYLAIIYREQGRFSESESVYKNALSSWPENPTLHKNLGILYDLYLDQPQDALKHYELALTQLNADVSENNNEASASKQQERSSKQLSFWIKEIQRRLPE